jgi:hypothetical protein
LMAQWRDAVSTSILSFPARSVMICKGVFINF